MGLGGFAFRRLVQSVPTLALVSVVIFGLMHLAPGDPVALILGADAPPQASEALRVRLGLDRPLPLQFVVWIGHVLVGDLGTSIRTNEPVSKMIADRFAATSTLAGMALLVSLAVAVPVGVLSAARRNTLSDYLLLSGTILGLAIPNFVLALILILTVAVRLRLLPISGYADFWSDPLDAWRFYVLPVLALAAARAAVLARMIRSTMLDVLHKEYVRTARAKGLPPSAVLLGHALRNSLMPLVTVLAINFGYLLGGSVVIEQIFGIPGLGTLLITAVLARDFPVIQGVTLVIAGVFLFTSLLADVLYTFIDPRLRNS
jgi:peptide/nickel transport system permease protein